MEYTDYPRGRHPKMPFKFDTRKGTIGVRGNEKTGRPAPRPVPEKDRNWRASEFKF